MEEVVEDVAVAHSVAVEAGRLFSALSFTLDFRVGRGARVTATSGTGDCRHKKLHLRVSSTAA